MFKTQQFSLAQVWSQNSAASSAAASHFLPSYLSSVGQPLSSPPRRKRKHLFIFPMQRSSLALTLQLTEAFVLQQTTSLKVEIKI